MFQAAVDRKIQKLSPFVKWLINILVCPYTLNRAWLLEYKWQNCCSVVQLEWESYNDGTLLISRPIKIVVLTFGNKKTLSEKKTAAKRLTAELIKSVV